MKNLYKNKMLDDWNKDMGFELKAFNVQFFFNRFIFFHTYRIFIFT